MMTIGRITSRDNTFLNYFSAENYNTTYVYYMIRQPLTDSFIHTKDVDSYVRMLKEIACGFDWLKSCMTSRRDEEASDSMPSDHRQVTGRLLEYLVFVSEKSNFEVGKLIPNILQVSYILMK